MYFSTKYTLYTLKKMGGVEVKNLHILWNIKNPDNKLPSGLTHSRSRGTFL